jgi:methylmalonyl-CoA/ethylmalonyl-CoA epimerase
LGNGKVKIGAHGNPVLFLHPKDFNGTLIELEQVVNSTTDASAE